MSERFRPFWADDGQPFRNPVREGLPTSAQNVEFYDDRDGLSVGRQRQIEDLKNYICGRVTREIVPGTLLVYRLEGYGAMEVGVHRFHDPGHDDTEPVGEGKFIHLWQYKDGAWKITRIISYDHHAAAK